MDRSSSPAASSRIIWLLGEGTSIAFILLALSWAGVRLPPLDDLPYVGAFFLAVFVCHYLCLAHLLWVGYGVRMAAILAVAHVPIFLIRVFGSAILPDNMTWIGLHNLLILCRLCFGIALIGTWRKLPSHVGIYGIAPILIALITLFIGQDHFAPILGYRYLALIEVCGSLYLAGLFLWNVGWGKRPVMEQKDDIPGGPGRAVSSP